MARIMPNTATVIDVTLEHAKALDRQRDIWQSAEGRNLPRRVADSAGPMIGRAAAMEAERVLHELITKLNEHLDNARYVLMEIGGEMAGIQAEAKLQKSGVRLDA